MSKLSKNTAWQAIINEKQKAFEGSCTVLRHALSSKLRAREENSKFFGSGGSCQDTRVCESIVRGTCKVMRNTSANSVAARWFLRHRSSGLRQKSSVGRLVKQWIQTFKHCLCVNPTHPGHWGFLIGKWASQELAPHFRGYFSRWSSELGGEWATPRFKFSIHCVISSEDSWQVQFTKRPWE